MADERREYDANENAYKREQREVHSKKADWEFLRDTVTPSPFYHNEHAWSVMWSLIEKRLAATRPAPKADSALVGELREKAEQADAAKRNLHGLPVLAMESDTHKGKLALWCDNGLAGVGQTCVAVNLGEFPDEQIKAIAALANIAATTDFAAILAALSDRDVVLEEAAKVAERRRDQRFEEYGTREPDTNATYYSGSMAETYEDLDEEDEEIAQAIRALKGGVDE